MAAVRGSDTWRPLRCIAPDRFRAETKSQIVNDLTLVCGDYDHFKPPNADKQYSNMDKT